MRKRLVVVTATAAVLLLAGCSDEELVAAEGSDDTSSPSSSSTWDPLVFPEPEWPPIPKGEPTTRQMIAGLNYIADAYGYGLQTGFEVPIRDTGCGCGYEDEVAELAAAGQHLEMEPVQLNVVAIRPVQRLRKGLYSIQARIRLERPAAVVVDAAGQQAGEERARSDVADVILNVDISGNVGWFVNAFRFTDSGEA